MPPPDIWLVACKPYIDLHEHKLKQVISSPEHELEGSNGANDHRRLLPRFGKIKNASSI